MLVRVMAQRVPRVDDRCRVGGAVFHLVTGSRWSTSHSPGSTLVLRRGTSVTTDEWPA
jgi:hypothetical protein